MSSSRYLLLLLALVPSICTRMDPTLLIEEKREFIIPISYDAEWNSLDAAFSMADLPWFLPDSFASPYDSLFFEHPGFIADGFDYPVGKPHGKGYYVAQGFGKNLHLGEDWNAVSGGNTDLGDTIYAIAHGYVRFGGDPGGRWGNTIRMIHKLESGDMLESLYAHCREMLVNQGQWVERGSPIATIGTANGHFLAHLHLELREDLSIPMRSGYSSRRKGYLVPRAFIQANRPQKGTIK